MVKIAINGFGRIGRTAFRALLERYADQLEVVAINTSGSMDIAGWAHFLKYDTVYGPLKQAVGVKSGEKGEIGRLLIGGREYPFLAQKDPTKIPWRVYGEPVVIEATGIFRTAKDCSGHLHAGAKKVIISAPAKDESPVYVIGVNTQDYRGEKIISNGSCTTNCVAPIIKVVSDNFKVERVVMTTIHAYTADQELVDGSHKDWRRGRAAALNIVPTSTGAAEVITRLFPKLAGRFEGLAIRVPVACGSLADFTFVLDQTVREKKVNQVLDQAAGGNFQGIIEVTNEPLVSSDVLGSSASALVDLSLTKVAAGNVVKLVAWYDNEWGYSCRLLELAKLIGSYD